MGARELKEKRTGWSFGEEAQVRPRHELPAEHLHSIEIPSSADAPAWDEPGYVDPDLHHANLPDGTRYWQGYAKTNKKRGGEERPLSPEFVTRLTRRRHSDEVDLTTQEAMDPHWERRTRLTQRGLISRMYLSLWP